MEAISDVIIVGGGIIGVSTAYFLAVHHGQRCVIVEKSSIGAGASGKAGGFLAKDWASDHRLSELYSKGFDLHVELSKRFSLPSYHSVDTFGVHHVAKSAAERVLNPAIPLGKTSQILDQSILGEIAGPHQFLREHHVANLLDRENLQVVPRELLDKLLEVALAHGVSVIDDTVDGLVMEGRTVKGVSLQCGEDIIGCNVLLCMGPWTGVACHDWLRDVQLPIFGIKASAIVFEDMPPTIAEHPWSCFCARDTHGCFLELHARRNGQLVLTGTGKSARVQGDELRIGGRFWSPVNIAADEHQVNNALISVREHFSMLDAVEPARTYGCMMPMTTDALPCMGAVPKYEHLFVCAGHGCWGILCGPISGQCMAELMVTGNCTTVDINEFDPVRFVR